MPRRSPVLAVLILAACGGDPDPAPEPAPPAAQPAEARPAERSEQVLIEGMPETLVLRLYRAPDGFPLGFGTYVPDDMQPEPVSSGEGDAIRFVAHFGGQRNERALLSFFVPPEGTTREAAQQLADAIASTQRTPTGTKQWYDWSVYERQYRGPGDVVGQVMVGEHRGRPFVVSAEHPAEMGDGFPPRARLILEHWRWADGETLLAPADALPRHTP
jgi:hypothetical protein